ncbi:terpene synthase family protein [Streptomyces lavendulocolor]|uniref:terpene synthase family protein n=1 Tax=Streptomyces lavendulocolor TaxID=67316 RepID=UPI003C2C6484
MTALPSPGPRPAGGPEGGPYPSFRLPAFTGFRPALRRPDLDELEASCRAWLDGALRPVHADDPLGFEEFLHHRTTLWNLLAYPTTDAGRTRTICHWIDVLFRIDDLFVHAPRPHREALGLHGLDSVLDPDPPSPRTPYSRVLAAPARRLRAGMPAGLWDRFAREMRAFFDACRTERDWLDARTAVDPAAYEASRVKSVGGCCFPLLEYGLGVDLTRELTAVPELGRLTHLVTRHWIAVNDIFSYRKELYGGDTVNQIALALAAGGGDLQEAVDGVAAVVGRIEREFRATGARLLDTAEGRSPAVRRYVEALHWMIAGNLEWSYITPRYNGRGHVWNGDATATVVLTPHRTVYLSESPRGPAVPPGRGHRHGDAVR